MAEEEIGLISSYFQRVSVAGVELSSTLRVGDRIHVKGHTTDFEAEVSSMQLDGREVEEGLPGQAVGVKVPDRVRHGDKVFKVL